MKSKFLFSLIAICLISLTFVSATDIAYLVRDLSNIEQAFIDSINELGFTYEIIEESNLPSNFNNYGLILIGNENLKLDKNILIENPSLILNPRYYEDWSRSKSSIASSQILTAFVADEEISITEFIPKNFPVYTSATYNGHSIPMYFLQGTKYNTSPVVTRGASGSELSRYVVAVKQNPRRVFFGITESDYWTQESKQLFKNSILWILNEENNNAPIFNGPIPDLTWQQDSYTELNLSEYFQDPQGQDLTFSVYNTSSNQDIYLTMTNSVVRFASTTGWTGTDWIIFQASNGVFSTLSNLINLEVIPSSNSQAPLLNSINGKSIQENSLLEFTISATDPNASEQLDFSVQQLPQGALFNDNNDKTATFSWTPTSEQIGVYFVTFEVENSLGLKDLETITIEVTEIPQPLDFNDVNLCQEITSDLKLKIKEPDNNDDFKAGDTIEIELELENKANEDMEVEVEVHLYDLDEDESIEEITEKIDIDEGDKETLDLELEIPSDIEDNDFVLLVITKADEEQEYCNYKYIDLEIKREKYDVRIKEIKMPEVVSPGENIEVKIEVENLGTRDQDVYIEIENLELEIQQQTKEFELEKYSDDNTETKILNVLIPLDAEEKDYTLRVTVYFDNEDQKESETKTFTIKTSSQTNLNTENSEINYRTNPLITLGSSNKISNTNEKTTFTNFQASNQKQKIQPSVNFNLNKLSQDELLLIIDIILIFGIIFEIIILTILKKRGYY